MFSNSAPVFVRIKPKWNVNIGQPVQKPTQTTLE